MHGNTKYVALVISMGRMNSKLILSILPAALAGCASSGVVPVRQDTFMVSKQSSTGFHASASVKIDIYREGPVYCENKGNKFQPVSDRRLDGIPA